jgi:HEPN domain-containing protein
LVAGGTRPRPCANDFAAGFYDGTVASSLQAAELALKALIVEVTARPPRKTHNLALLEQALTNAGRQVPSAVSAAIGRLPESIWIEARYPDPATGHVPARDVTKADATRALTDGSEIVAWVQSEL